MTALILVHDDFGLFSASNHLGAHSSSEHDRLTSRQHHGTPPCGLGALAICTSRCVSPNPGHVLTLMTVHGSPGPSIAIMSGSVPVYRSTAGSTPCLLYTSDAADERSSV